MIDTSVRRSGVKTTAVAGAEPELSIYLGIDVGTQSVKTLFFDTQELRMAASASAPLDLIARDDGTREQMAHWWVAALRHCLERTDPTVRNAVAAIGVSGQQHGFVPLSANGEALAPVKLWCDTSTYAECEEITTAFGGRERCISELGNPVLPGYTASKIRWLKKYHPGAYSGMASIMLPHDYLNFFLTGERVMECGDASGTGLLDVRKRQWHGGMLAALDAGRDLRKCLPELVPPDAFIGTLRPSVAEELGLPPATPVSCGGGDNMMAAIGTGNVASGRVTVSLGTSGTVFAYADRPVVDDSGLLAAFCDSTGGWLPLLCTMNCTVATELTRNLLDIPLDELESLAGKVPAGANGVLTLPFFQGERTPNLPDARGCLFGLSSSNYRPENLLRSAMESAVYGLRYGLESFAAAGVEARAIRLTGGGARSAAWRQMVADIFNQPVAVQKIDEGAALGAALQAYRVDSQQRGDTRPLADVLDEMLGIDQNTWCEPCARNVEQYADHYQRYLEHLTAITPLYQH